MAFISTASSELQAFCRAGKWRQTRKRPEFKAKSSVQVNIDVF
jgi:hypothetical protein